MKSVEVRISEAMTEKFLEKRNHEFTVIGGTAYIK